MSEVCITDQLDLVMSLCHFLHSNKDRQAYTMLFTALFWYEYGLHMLYTIALLSEKYFWLYIWLEYLCLINVL